MKKFATIFGVVMLAVGILGFVPALTPDGKLFGVFAVNGMHNAVHILTGVVALACGAAGDHAARMYFRVFGVVYALVAVLGIVRGDQPLMGMAHNMADMGLHVVIAALALYLGFGHRTDMPPQRGSGPNLRGA